MDVRVVEPLHFLPEEKWLDLELSLKLDWPRSICPINVLKTLKRLPELRRIFNFKIYCPYGDVTIGVVLVATYCKDSSNDVIIHCNRELETFVEAIKDSKVIDWHLAPVTFTDRQVMESITRVMRRHGVECCQVQSCDTIYLDCEPLAIQIPDNLSFGHLSLEHVEKVDTLCKHRYPGSDWYFEQLIKLKLGYGLFEKATNELVAWMFFTELGTYDNLYILDSHRKKGYGKLLTLIAYNSIQKETKHAYALSLKVNSVALDMYKKIGFKVIGETIFTSFQKKTPSKM